jgi:hypothetical protein
MTHHLQLMVSMAWNWVLGTLTPGFMLDCYTSNPRQMHLCAFSDIAGAFGGQGVFGLVVAALVFVGGYSVGDGDIVTPGIVLMLIGSVMIPSLPAQYQTLALTLMFAGAVGAVMQLLGKYVFGATVT